MTETPSCRSSLKLARDWWGCQLARRPLRQTSSLECWPNLL
ncbi:hypothetical protein [Paenibacillus sp. TH7-28]